jgi:hypothetical protein
MESGEWRMENAGQPGEWRMENGEWRMPGSFSAEAQRCRDAEMQRE